MRIGVLGFGKLGSLIVKRLLNVGVVGADIRVVERPSNKKLIHDLGITGVTTKEIGDANLVILATKPTQFEHAWDGITLSTPSETVIVSFMAKVGLQTIVDRTKTNRVVRAMTSTPCELGLGIGAWIPHAGVEPELLGHAEWLMGQLGVHLKAESEEQIAHATVLSSMNGMMFLLIQAMRQGLNTIGASRDFQALVLPLISNAIAYSQHRAGDHPVSLADEVTSPAGTTAALRLVLSRAGIDAVIIDAIVAAHDKAKEEKHHKR